MKTSGLMRKTLYFAVLAAVLAVYSAPAKADPKPVYWTWWPSHWENLTFNPYLEHPTEPQNTQWDDRKWDPADWVAQREGGCQQIICGLYRAEILHKQYVDNEVPVLEVGPNFYSLSGYDKRRVLRLIDDHYKITANHENAMFTVADWQTHKPIGLYTAHGLQLQ